PGTVGADVRTARLAVVLGGDVLQQRADRLVPLGRATGHDRGPVQRALLTAGDAHPEEVQALLPQCGLPPAGVLVVRVPAVHHDVARLEQLGQGVDGGVSALPGLHHDHHPARTLQAGDEVGELGGRHEALVTVGSHQLLGAGRGAVVHRHRVAVVGEVAGQV